MAALTVLGIWDGHDAGACLVHNGRLEIAISEERLVRQKRASGFPFQAVAACLRHAQIKPSDVDLVAAAGRYGRLGHRVADRVYRRSDPDRDPLSAASTLVRRAEIGLACVPGLRRLEERSSAAVLQARLRRLGIRAALQLVSHHDAHAWTARLVASSPDAMIVTMDGYGDGLAGTFDALTSDREELPSPRCSPALVYGAVTRLLGYSEGDEGKVMGLAASGDPAPLDAFFRAVIGFGRCDPRLGGRVRRQEILDADPANVAAALQARVEDVVCGWIEARRRGRAHLAVSGGLFANVSLNGCLAHRFDAVRVFPHMGDGGLCVGAAAAALDGAFQFPELPFLGPTVLQGDLDAALVRSGYPLTHPDDLEAELVERLASGDIVGRLVGRSEFGPRALGHRSILLRADRPDLVSRLNSALGRDPVMPFAPIRRSGQGSATMTVVYAADAPLRAACPAAVHVDGTARTQLVSEQADPGLWRLLAMCEARGMPALINTSFNLHGEPIVETAEDALSTFEAAQLDALQLGDALVSRAR